MKVNVGKLLRAGGGVTMMVFLSPLFMGAAMAQSGDAGESGFWLWQFLGRLHPLAVHFPVGLLLFAAVIELFTIRNYHSPYRAGINLMIYVGAFAAVLAAVLGLLLANVEEYGGDTLTLHQWTGVATAALAVITLVLLLGVKKGYKPSRIKAYRGLLFFTALGVSVAGHFGASLTHGDEYLTSVLPWSGVERVNAADFDFAAYEGEAGGLTEEQELKLLGEVRAIMAHSCYSCHSEEKVRGDLKLD